MGFSESPEANPAQGLSHRLARTGNGRLAHKTPSQMVQAVPGYMVLAENPPSNGVDALGF